MVQLMIAHTKFYTLPQWFNYHKIPTLKKKKKKVVSCFLQYLDQ